MSDHPFLQAKAISKVYDGKHSAGVRNVSIEIQPGIITAIIGESGSGKSTLLRLLYGLLSPQQGEVRFRGEKIWGPEEKLIPGHDSMKMVTQHADDLNLFANVWDNIATLLPNTNLKYKKERSEELLQQLNMLHMADKKIATLSGGEKQRVAIARALALKPEVLFLDEPFNQVDTSFREGLQRDIRNIVKETGLTVIMVSHDPAEVLSMADELVVIRNGEIIEHGTPHGMYNHPENFYTAKLLSNCNVLNNQQAKELHIEATMEKVVIYPEWISIVQSFMPKKWIVAHILFKGPYEELILTHDGISIKMFNLEVGKYALGKGVNVKVSKHLEF
ncbi:ABC transporter ATP-binding protein [Mucilaginibacter agri]|uniref:ATP-binding cassette domain-containing protein n=1 Tax=Mucilaginibacter agri TaxID=2695265 RepID=A0A966DTM5_9SPHI|nr:ABC transporter ATP-binding protein [Mucilaginibacter agri]NCD71423.1 ATP-binding cassette domain-containing protein [Mucilaginibacter agri]